MTGFDTLLTTLNGILWHDSALLILLGTGVVFTVWSGFSQYKALTHGVQVVRGTYDDPDDPGAISHFQALSAALSATVGLGNIGWKVLATHEEITLRADDGRLLSTGARITSGCRVSGMRLAVGFSARRDVPTRYS